MGSLWQNNLEERRKELKQEHRKEVKFPRERGTAHSFAEKKGGVSGILVLADSNCSIKCKVLFAHLRPK